MKSIGYPVVEQVVDDAVPEVGCPNLAGSRLRYDKAYGCTGTVGTIYQLPVQSHNVTFQICFEL
jgi:hypothetical protein